MPKIPVSQTELVANLKKIGYNDLMVGHKGRRNIVVLVDDASKKNRVSALQKIAAELDKLDVIASYDPTFDQRVKSTLGQVKVKSTESYGDFDIVVKGKKKFGDMRPGVANEILLEETIKRYAKDISDTGYITVEFRGGGKTMTVGKVVTANRVGDTAAKGAKSDVTLISKPRGKEKRVPLSLKEDNAGNWASSDSYWNPIASKIVEHALVNNLVSLSKMTNIIYRLSKEITVNVTKNESEVAIFGTDILQNDGAILKKTFNQDSFEWIEEKQTLIVRVDYIWRTLSDIPANLHPALVIRNDAGRGNIPGYKGLRPTIVPKSRTGSSQVRIKRSDIGKPTKPKGKK